jgi:hypothetical protein
MSFAEHQSFAPMLDELVVYTKLSLQSEQPKSLEQTMTLVKFANAFNVKDHQFWRQVQSCLKTTFTAKEPTNTLFRTASYLKEYNLISNHIMRTIAETNLDGLVDSHELCAFYMMTQSDEWKSIASEDLSARLEEKLSAATLDKTQFSLVCSCIEPGQMENFLQSKLVQVHQWLAKHELECDELCQVARVFSSRYNDYPAQLH